MDEHPCPRDICPKPPAIRLLSVLCVVYCVLLPYASMMPFDFTADAAHHELQVQRAWQFRPFGDFRVSRTDLISNVMVYVPLGFLISTRIGLAGRRRRWAAFIAGTAAGAAISAPVEYAQSFMLSRISSATDVLNNLIGSSAGAAAGALFGPWAWFRLTGAIREAYARRPVAIVASLVLLMIAADATFPWLPTIDVSAVKGHIRQSAITLQDGFSRHPWHRWVVEQAGVYAVLTILLGASSRRASPGRWVRAAAFALCFAAAAEAGKIFIMTRSANVANVISAAGGILVALILAAVFRSGISPRVRRILPVVLLAAYVVYFELTPFAFTWDFSRLAERMPRRPEWLPLYNYAIRSRTEDVRLFLRTLILAGALLYAATLLWRRLAEGTRFNRILRAGLLAGGLGLVLELGQFFLPRVPSATDVFCFAAGGALGAVAYLYYPPPEPDE